MLYAALRPALGDRLGKAPFPPAPGRGGGRAWPSGSDPARRAARELPSHPGAGRDRHGHGHRHGRPARQGDRPARPQPRRPPRPRPADARAQPVRRDRRGPGRPQPESPPHAGAGLRRRPRDRPGRSPLPRLHRPWAWRRSCAPAPTRRCTSCCPVPTPPPSAPPAPWHARPAPAPVSFPHSGPRRTSTPPCPAIPQRCRTLRMRSAVPPCWCSTRRSRRARGMSRITAVPDPACPICGNPVPPDTRTRPFCSVRCADVDLGRWFGGQYRIPGPSPDQEEDEAPGR